MTIPVHIAIDLESLDTRPTAVVLSVGLAAFTVPGGLVGAYYTEPLREDQLFLNRTTDRGTVAWWNAQEGDCGRVLRQPAGVPVVDALNGIASFIGRFDGGSYHIDGIWGFGAAFDNAMLADLFRTAGHPVPWSYKANRCGRTVTALAKQLGQERPPNVGTLHNALDDAVWLAEYIRLSLLKLGLR